MDREKIIKAAEICLRYIDDGDCPTECPYFDLCTKYEKRVVFQPLIRDALALLKEQEEVVRCKDCKWWDKKDDSNYGYCHACKHGYHSDHWEIGIYRTYKGNWFCADGERKEGR